MGIKQQRTTMKTQFSITILLLSVLFLSVNTQRMCTEKLCCKHNNNNRHHNHHKRHHHRRNAIFKVHPPKHNTIFNQMFADLDSLFENDPFFHPRQPSLATDHSNEQLTISDVYKAINKVIPRHSHNKSPKVKFTIKQGDNNKVRLVKTGPNKFKLKIKVNPENKHGLQKEFYKAVYSMVPTEEKYKTQDVLDGLYDNLPTVTANKVAFTIRGIFSKLGAKDEVDINKERRGGLSGAIDTVIEKIESDYKKKIEVMRGLKAVDEKALKAEREEEEKDRKLVLGAVGKVVEDVKRNMEVEKKKVEEKKEKELSEEEVRMLVNAYKRLKYSEGTTKEV